MAGDGSYIYFTFTVDGVDTLEKKLRLWGQDVSDLSPVLEEIGGDMRADFMQNMIGEGSIFNAARVYRGGRVVSTGSGGRWADLAPSTVAERERKGYGGAHPIEWRDGTLAESLATRGALGNVSQVDKTRGVFGTTVPYAGYQQTGTSKMPARKIVGLTRQRKEAIVRKVGDFVRAAARAAGLNARG